MIIAVIIYILVGLVFSRFFIKLEETDGWYVLDKIWHKVLIYVIGVIIWLPLFIIATLLVVFGWDE